MAQPGMMKDSYNDNSQAQASLFDQCRDLFCTAAQDALLPAQDRPFTIAEWGCSHGGNSIAPVLLLCEQLQQRLQQLPANNRSHCQPLQVLWDARTPGTCLCTLPRAATLRAELEPESCCLTKLVY
jgi:hypothetical protein